MTIWSPEVETMPRERLRELQGQRLRAQVAYVHERSAFYRRKFAEIGLEPGDVRELEDVRKLPFVSKDELRRCQEQAPPLGAHVCASREEVVWLPSTSGTTGTPLLLPRTAADIETWTELNARAFSTVGIGRDDVYQNILSYNWIYGGLALHLGAQRTGATVLNAGMGNTEKQMWALKHMGTTAFHATPSYLVHLGNRFAEAGETELLSVRAIIAGGEVGMAGAEGKRRLRSLFPQVQTFADVGGVTDVGTMIWAECEHMCGGHLAEDAVICEVLDTQTGQPVAPGEVGELVFTDVVSRGAPLLRYRVNDLTRTDETRCACGRTLARMPDGILGRVDDMLTVRAANVYPSAIDEIVKSFAELSGEYQLIVEAPRDLDVMTLRVERAGELSEEAQADLLARIDERVRMAFGSRAEIELLAPGTLPTFLYKAKRIIDRRRGESEQDALARAQEQARG
ncbi:MAG: phenylacetate--CoA ligase family protein [Solirubrobacteraceae bacterium]